MASRKVKLRSKRQKSFGDYGEKHPIYDEDDCKQIKYRKVIVDPGERRGDCHKSKEAHEKISKPEFDDDDDESSLDPLEELIGTLPRVSSTIQADADDDAISTKDSASDVDDDDCKVNESEESDRASEHEDEAADDEDPFAVHLDQILTRQFVERLNNKESWKLINETWPILGSVRRTRVIENCVKLSYYRPNDKSVNDLSELMVKTQVHDGWVASNRVHIDDEHSHDQGVFNALQSELFTVMNSYTDLLFSNRTHENGEQIRATYCLHILNHALKTRNRILQHNSQISKRWTDVPDEYRDQGLSRPKTLILVPFRESALRIVNQFINILLPEGKGNVMNKKRFHDHYGSGTERLASRGKLRDHDATFAGNIDDNFRLGISITKKSMRLYTNFYSSDIIVASPLGLRMLIGAKGDSERNFDFLASIEILVIDQADVLFMQNWEHVTHVLDHLNLQPTNSRGIDFSRVRQWSLESGWAKHYRQTMCFASITSPEINSIFSRACCNYAGLTRTVAPIIGGSIRQVVVQLPQVFHRFQTLSARDEPEARFQYFISKILPQFVRESVTTRTLLYVPSYLDYVRLRNRLRREEASFAQICEYTDPGKVAQARYRFVHSLRRILLYTERAHFFQRYRLKGIRHLVFYQLPLIPHFYSELCNLTLLQGKARNASAGGSTDKYFTCTTLFSRFDAHRLTAVVGTERAAQMVTTDEKDVFMFVTGET